MRHPFWPWTTLFCIGLTGCLHGQDWRAAVMSHKIQSVADRRESRPKVKVAGPLHRGQSKFLPPPQVATSPGIAAHPVAAKVANEGSQLPQETTQPLAVTPKAQSRSTQFVPVRREALPLAQPAVSVVPVLSNSERLQAISSPTKVSSTSIVELQHSGSFAEFEREIPQARSVSAHSAALQKAPFEDVFDGESEPANGTKVPVISPASSVVKAKSRTDQRPHEQIQGPEESASDDQPRGLFSRSVVLAKELPEVTETTSAEKEKMPSNVDDEPSIRPQDVSILVEQVFEDLRLRRLNDARQRTEWLRQLVMKRTPGSTANVVQDEKSVEVNDIRSGEPRRVDLDPQATGIEELDSDSVVTDEETTSSKEESR